MVLVHKLCGQISFPVTGSGLLWSQKKQYAVLDQLQLPALEPEATPTGLWLKQMTLLSLVLASY